MPDEQRCPLPVRVATTEVLDVNVVSRTAADQSASTVTCQLVVKSHGSGQIKVDGTAATVGDAIVAAVGKLCSGEIQIRHLELHPIGDTQICCLLALDNSSPDPDSESKIIINSTRGELASDKPLAAKAGVGRATSNNQETAITLAALRAANHAGLLNRQHRANNQKVLREWASETAEQVSQSRSSQTPDEIQQLLIESLILDAFNRVASAAVITATNHPRPESILSLFDTSVWLFDSDGQRRDSYTDTNLWLAWYPGVDNDREVVDDVIHSMPAAPDSAIPWIVKLFENPSSRFRFRGAVDLEDHDVLHVLLGRGLQDQDEAFVLGFAMGTAKTISSIEIAVFRFILTRLYPEPYKIPNFLSPAFNLGVQCGRETGNKNLYKQSLKDLRSLSLGKARSATGIDMQIVRRYYQAEQEQIPYTIASLRLP